MRAQPQIATPPAIKTATAKCLLTIIDYPL
ncbi:hypothetical protein GJW-30_1_00069 [Variibacter gotjawalensis]|uniref:Uncharacterized protein n=1 Tax=Variibacter gotjawalensis TaxID=1333996 RepID=A0A0S3PNR2_9BRAD|nr:hypothetical protein [Variibacter gotjawalensis]RZS49735.1 hypothetical protein EV661_2175 [Variibacter gotjawalensis]BAT57563.1 hypothetical protein GJW-30_1_00069 [Variibacter gotjawalensis]